MLFFCWWRATLDCWYSSTSPLAKAILLRLFTTSELLSGVSSSSSSSSSISSSTSSSSGAPGVKDEVKCSEREGSEEGRWRDVRDGRVGGDRMRANWVVRLRHVSSGNLLGDMPRGVIHEDAVPLPPLWSSQNWGRRNTAAGWGMSTGWCHRCRCHCRCCCWCQDCWPAKSI